MSGGDDITEPPNHLHHHSCMLSSVSVYIYVCVCVGVCVQMCLFPIYFCVYLHLCLSVLWKASAELQLAGECVFEYVVINELLSMEGLT